jgi:hypothetical protein
MYTSALGTGSWSTTVPFDDRPGVRTVPVSVVSEFALQLVGTAPHKLPVQVGAPATQDCTPLVGLAKQAAPLPQLPVQLVSLPQPGQQSRICPQPSDARPQLWPS